MPWSQEKRRKAAERMRKLNADPEFKAKVRASKWHCPDGFEVIYRKARNILGVAAARAQIEALARDETSSAAIAHTSAA